MQTASRHRPGATSPTGRAGGFERDARRALDALAQAFRDAVAAVAPPGTNALAVSRALRIDKSLSWRIARFTGERDAIEGSQHLPGEAGLRIYAAAVHDAGAPEAVVRALGTAIDRLERVIGEHAGSRAAFRAMLAHCRPDVAEDERTLEFRRSAFIANSALWGIEARARVMVAVMAPDADGRTGLIVASGFFGLRRMRPGLSWPLARRRVRGPHGHAESPDVRPLDPESGPGDAPILREFTTVGAGDLRAATGPEGLDWELAPGEVGRAGAVDCVFGERFAAIGSPGPRTTELMLRLDLPCERAVIEVFVDRTIAHGEPPSAALHGLLTGGTGANDSVRDRARLPLAERPVLLPHDPAGCPIPEVPRHWELVNDCIRASGRAHGGFVGHRLEIRHPMIPTALSMSVTARA